MNTTILASVLAAALAAGAGAAPTAATNAAAAPAAPTLPLRLDLATCRGLALEHNPQIRIAVRKLDEQDGAIALADAPARPQVGVTADYLVTDKDRMETFGNFAMNDESAAAEAQVRQLLYGGGRVAPQRRAARAGREAGVARVAAVRNDVLLRVYGTYYDALLAKAEIGVQEESIRLFAEQLAIASNRYASGAGPQFDVVRARVALANAQPPLIRAKNAQRIAVDALGRIIGLPFAAGQGAANVTLDEDWTLGKFDIDPAVATAFALTNRAEIAALRREQEAARETLLAARHTNYPELGAFAGYGGVTRRFEEGFSDPLYGWQAGVQASWPLFDGGAGRGQVLQAASRLHQLELQEEDLVLSIETEVRRALSNWEEAAEILRVSDLVIGQAEEALRLANNRFKAGVATQLDVLDSQFELTRSRLVRVQSVRNYNVAGAELKRAAGVLEARP